MVFRLPLPALLAVVTLASCATPPPAPVAEAADLALVPMAELRALERATPWECEGYDEATRTCEGVGRTTWGDGRTGRSGDVRVINADPRVVVALSGPEWFEADRACGRAADVSVELVEGPPSPGLAERVEALARERIAAAYGNSVLCSGLVRDGDGFREVIFRDGVPTGRTNAFRLFAERPSLRAPSVAI